MCPIDINHIAYLEHFYRFWLSTTRFLEVYRENWAASVQHIVFSNIPRSENAPSSYHMYSIDMNHDYISPILF